MKKRDLIRKNMVESVNNERNILAMANNPFVVRFYYSFTSKENLYIVMEYLNGGDCYRCGWGCACVGLVYGGGRGRPFPVVGSLRGGTGGGCVGHVLC